MLLTVLLALSLPAPPAVRAAAPLPAWDARFDGQSGWIGGDGVYSVAVSPTRTVWIFSDTLVGRVENGKRVGTVMVNNTVGVQAGRGPVTFTVGQDAKGKPAALFVPPDGRGWFWPWASVLVGRELLIFQAQIEKAGSGAFGFKHVGQWLTTVANPEDEPDRWKTSSVPLPMCDPARGRVFGSAALVVGDELFVYGYAGPGLGRSMTVARVPTRSAGDFSTWRYRTADGWSHKPEEAVRLATGVGSEYSVTPKPGGGYLLVTTAGGLSDRIVARTANHPTGPWSAAAELYRCPEGADKGLFCYAAKAHPHAAEKDEVVISYVANAHDFGRLFRDASVYRPRFVRVELGR